MLPPISMAEWRHATGRKRPRDLSFRISSTDLASAASNSDSCLTLTMKVLVDEVSLSPVLFLFEIETVKCFIGRIEAVGSQSIGSTSLTKFFFQVVDDLP